MASVTIDYYFSQGRNGKVGGGPGLLIVEGKYKFKYNQSNKAKTVYKMYCVQQGNIEFSCKAKATVTKREDGSFVLNSCDNQHNHFINTAEIIAEEWKNRMAELVRKVRS